MSDGTSGYGSQGLMRLFGVLPGVPVIACKDEGTAVTVGGAVREYISKTPTIVVVDDWPEAIEENAVVVVPLHMIGTDAVDSFGLDYELSDRAEKTLRYIITHKMSNDGQSPSYREIAAAIGVSSRSVKTYLDELRDAGLINRTAEYRGIITSMGKWRPDKKLAELSGVAK